MSAPVRIQLSRAKGWRMPANTVKVDRTTRWGNSYRVGATHCPRGFQFQGGQPLTAAEAVKMHRAEVGDRLNREPDYLEPLRGKNIACWCKIGDPCHGDTYVEMANR